MHAERTRQLQTTTAVMSAENGGPHTGSCSASDLMSPTTERAEEPAPDGLARSSYDGRKQGRAPRPAARPGPGGPAVAP